ncbi:TPA: hypothetical protein DDY55_03490 [Candidatus Falkowbacteria bacterium]|nr:hypothetical protein [Candidatus Falkowbacteria bacterium]HBT27239.1 hypothetical protein [Candidatus Falkowbacteria bacterium]HBY15092.1 hypothetical protein [Candidatus Falkowbacteria bacterium]
MRFYHSFDSINQIYNVPQTDHVYIVSINNKPFCSNEICELGWFTKDDISDNKVKVPPVFWQKIYPMLINENFL